MWAGGAVGWTGQTSSYRTGETEYSTGNIVNSIVMAVRSARWVMSNRGDHFLNYVHVSSLYCRPETNIK